jgi:transketolase
MARKHPHIALIVGDLGYSVVEPFAEEFPDRFVNAGVAEQNMTGLAAGMASEGYHVFTYSIANFPTFRCAEHIRNDVAYHRLSVTVVAVGGGLAYGSLGYSHHAVQDYALIRSMPGMLIAAPGDPMETHSCVRYLVEHPGPSYLRLGKSGETNFHSAPPAVVPGGWLRLREGRGENTMLGTGGGVALALDWIKTKAYEDYSVHSMPLWSMAEKASQFLMLGKYKNITTVEDHLVDGGFGSWLLESGSLAKNPSFNITNIALSQAVCELVGSQAALSRAGGILPYSK